jgi:integrase
MSVLKFRLPEKTNKKEELVVTYDNDSSKVSLYSDHVWNFSSSMVRRTRYGFNLNFDRTFSNGQKLLNKPLILETYKDLMYKLSNSGIKFQSLQHNFHDIFTFLDYMYSQLNVENICTLSENDVNDYVEYLTNKKISYNTIRSRLFIVKNGFFKYRNELDYCISFEPFKNINITKKVKNNSNVTKHKQTELIPDKEWKDIIKLSKSYIDLYNKHLESEDYVLNVYKHSLTLTHNNFRAYYTSVKFLKNVNHSNYKTRTEHLSFIKNVQISCAMIIQAFTGMRMSELHSITKDCIIHDIINSNNEQIDILKIKGRTYKYVEKNNFGKEAGREVFWICPPIVEEAINTLNHINKGTLHYLSTKDIEISESSVFMAFQSFSDRVAFDVDIYYKRFLDEHNIKLDFEFSSHSFRRTFARFLARSLIDIPIEVIREQFKHYSKHITFYYMREDEKADIEFAELISEYVDNKDNESSKYLFSEIKTKLDNSILTARNVDELLEYVDGRKINLINEFMASVNEKPEILSPIGCLTCNGNVIIPNIHSSYWQDLLVLYDEMIELEPNSIWHKQEREMVKKVVLELENNNVYITGEIK